MCARNKGKGDKKLKNASRTKPDPDIASWPSLPKEENKNPKGFLDRGPGETCSDLVGNPLSRRRSDGIMRRFLL